MGFGWKKIKPRPRTNRGCDAIADLAENWNEWKSSISALSDEERTALEDKFEEACSGAGDAIVLDDAKEFIGEASSWSAEDKEAFKSILIPEYLEYV